MLLSAEIGGNDRTECGWVSPWDGDLGGLFLLLERGFLGKMVGADVLMDMVFEVVVVEAVDVVQAGFFVFFQNGCLGDMMGVRVVIEDVVGAVVLVWWRWSVV